MKTILYFALIIGAAAIVLFDMDLNSAKSRKAVSGKDFKIIAADTTKASTNFK